ncbi:MAG: hypothetical protein MPJ50_17315 [Pirellulales bacterium]|nr:hypothetical protein [Pirellulales bacterium]
MPLRDEHGNHIKTKEAADAHVKAAHARYLLDRETMVVREPPEAPATTILEVCVAYLRYAKMTGAAKTHKDRCDILFDFCFGLPPAFRNKDASSTKRLTMEEKLVLKDANSTTAMAISRLWSSRHSISTSGWRLIPVGMAGRKRVSRR